MLLERLSNACGIAGREDEVRELLKAELAPHADDMWTDVMGNLIVRKGSGPVKVLLDAHMDEVGFCISAITDEGYLKLKTVGAIDNRVIPGRQVWVTNQRIPGVIGAKAWHLTSADDRRRAIPLEEMYVDLGCRSRDEVEALGVELGDPVYFATTFERLGQRTVKGKAMDDRAGCAVLAEILAQTERPELTLYGVFAVQEEVGLRGARAAAYNIHPDLAIAIDCTAASDAPGVDEIDISARMGAGPVLYLVEGGTAPNPLVFDALVRLALENGIPHQFKKTAAGGTDAGAIATARSGVPVCSLSIPGRYIHTNASLISLDDFDATVRLVDRFLDSVAKGDLRP